MKKYSKLLVIASISLVVGVIILLLIVLITGGMYGFDIFNSNSSVANGSNSRNVVLNEFDSVKISSVNENIKFIPSNEFRIEYNLDNRFNVGNCQVNGKTLVFDYQTPNYKFGYIPSYAQGYINIYYDQFVTNGEFNTIELDMILSTVDFGGFNYVNKLDLSVVSQNIFANFDLNQAYINIVSGNINISSLGENPSKIDIDTVSGNININLSENDVDVQFNSLVGKSYVNGVEFKSNYRTLDGKTNIEIDSVTGDFNLTVN